MTGGNFEIFADTFSMIQDQVTTAGNFTLSSSGGEFFATTTQSGTYTLKGGFQALERASLSLSVSHDSISLGEMSLSQVKSAEVVLQVTTDASTGYTAIVSEDGNLRKGEGGANDDINDVQDGSVTAGSEEYGFTTSGEAALIATDMAIQNSLAIAQSNGVVNSQETTVTFKGSIGPQSRAGSYSHNVTFTVTANP